MIQMTDTIKTTLEATWEELMIQFGELEESEEMGIKV